MSEPSSAEDIRKTAAEWLIKRQDSEAWSAVDDSALNDWLAQSPAHTIAYWRLENVWGRADRLGALRRPMRESALERARPIFAKAVAALTLVAITGAGATAYFAMPGGQTYETPLGGREVLTLRDGSQIELNTSTSVRIADRVDRREIWLDHGEAYFDVKHDEKRPFVVIAGNHRVTDLGTKFLMRRDHEKLQVAVVEGDVRFNPASDASRAGSTVLRAGDVAVANADSVSVTKRATSVLSDELGWRRGVLMFRHTRLADAVAEFNRYNQQKITVTDPAVGRLRIGGTFPTANVEGFADAAKEILGLHISRRGDETVISR